MSASSESVELDTRCARRLDDDKEDPPEIPDLPLPAVSVSPSEERRTDACRPPPPAPTSPREGDAFERAGIGPGFPTVVRPEAGCPPNLEGVPRCCWGVPLLAGEALGMGEGSRVGVVATPAADSEAEAEAVASRAATKAPS